MADVAETTEQVEHTHEDGTTHSHAQGDVEHTHVEEDAEAPAFNLGDLAAVKQIIEVSSRRGAFNAAELSAVGGTYDRLMQFLQYHVPAADESAQAEEAEIETKPDPTDGVDVNVDDNSEPEIDRD